MDLCLCLERFSTAAGVRDIRIRESKSRTYSILGIVHLAPDYRKEGLRVNEYSYTVLLDNFIKLGWLIDIFEMVRHAGASFVAYAYSN